MARAYGRFTTDIWRDPKFRALAMDQQWAYFMLGTQADISAAGMLPYTVKRWSGYASDATSDRTSDALSSLVAKRFIVVDEDSEELLVRAFAKWDGGIHNEKRRPVVIEAAQAIASPVLRAVMAQELRDLGLPDAVCDALSDSPSDALSDAVSPSDRVVVSTSVSPYQPTTLNPEPQPATSEPFAPDLRRGSRIAASFRPTPGDIEWARDKQITALLARHETEKFIHYWTAKSGREATKSDWSATWRHWMLNALERAGQVPGTSPPGRRPSGGTDERVIEHLELSQRLEGRGA